MFCGCIVCSDSPARIVAYKQAGHLLHDILERKEGVIHTSVSQCPERQQRPFFRVCSGRQRLRGLSSLILQGGG